MSWGSLFQLSASQTEGHTYLFKIPSSPHQVHYILSGLLKMSAVEVGISSAGTMCGLKTTCAEEEDA